jgi:predicted phage terminase large subunit-like protein
MGNWHLEAICYALYQCWLGDITRLIITLPPRNGKSICTSIALPAFILGHDSTQRIIVTSYGGDLAAELSNATRKVMKAIWYQSAFPMTLIDPNKDKEAFFRTTLGGHRLATSVGGAITGLGGNWIIIDDPMKASIVPTENELQTVVDYYAGTLYSRLDNKKDGRIILIMQRTHEEDLVGYLTKQQGWHHLNLPAIAQVDEKIPIGEGVFHTRSIGEALHPAREPLEELARIKEQLGPHAFGAQYQQTPIPIGGGIVEWERFKWYSQLPNNGQGGLYVQSWDTAMDIHETNSYSVCTTWFRYQGNNYLIDVWRQRMRPADLLIIMHQHAIKYRADLVIIERHNGSEALIETLFQHTRLNLLNVRPTGSKIQRMAGEYAAITGGLVFLPKTATWLPEFRSEIVKFPQAKHDDQVDSLSQYLLWARSVSPKNPSGGGRQGLGHPGGPAGLTAQPVGNVKGGRVYFF